jgi:hypothetical protein
VLSGLMNSKNWRRGIKGVSISRHEFSLVFTIKKLQPRLIVTTERTISNELKHELSLKLGELLIVITS